MSADARPNGPDEFDTDDFGQMDAVERVGPPLFNRRRRRAKRWLVLLMVAGGLGWMWHEERLGPAVRVGGELIAAVSQLAPDRHGRPVPTGSPAAADLAAAPVPVSEVDRAANPAPSPALPAPEPTPPAAPRHAAVEPLPPVPSATDPLARRAEAAGLHPDLSKALLARFSDEDFRNAAQAISAALMKIPDEGVYEWPRTTALRAAQFRVRFVVGAGEQCRRYVVEIAKDGWLTTALPMERCGVRGPSGRG